MEEQICMILNQSLFFATIVESINWYEFGVGSILLIAGLVVGYSRLKEIITKNKKLASDMDVSQPTIPNSKRFPIDLTTHCFFHERITEVRINNDLEFVAIGNFHNGSSFLDGTQMKKMSWVFESMSIRHRSYIKYFQDILLSSIIQCLRPLVYGEKYSYMTRENMQQALVRSFLETTEIDNLLFFPISDKSGFIVGLLWFGWNNFPEETTEQKAERQKTLVDAGQALVTEIEFEIPAQSKPTR